MSQLPPCCYRISIKALILNETRDKFLITLEENGHWELPGGGLDWGMTPQEDLPREIKEEMGLETLWVAEYPSYFLTAEHAENFWVANLLYETTVKDLHAFTPSDECVEVRFVDKEDITTLPVFPNVARLADMFSSHNHLPK